MTEPKKFPKRKAEVYFEEDDPWIWRDKFEAKLKEMLTQPRMYEFFPPHPIKIIEEILEWLI